MNLRKAGISFGFLVALIFMFSFCYYFSYERALDEFNLKSIEQNSELIPFLTELTKEQFEEHSESMDSIPVDVAKEPRVKPETVYKLETYDIATDSTETEVLNPPGKFVGLSREELTSLLAEEMTDMPFSEYQKGLVSYVLISFSEEEIVLRKSYNSELVQYKYYLAIYDGEVVVYYSDRKTVCDHTGIEAAFLSEKSQAELSLGKYVKDEAELYSLLESYSS